MLRATCDLSNTITQRCPVKTALTPFSMCHGMLSSLHLTFWRQARSRGGSRGDFNTEPLPLSLRACATAYQMPLSDVGNPGPCPPNPCRPDCLFCPNQIENYKTDTATVYINASPGSLSPLCGREERSLDINLSFILTRLVSSSFPFSPHLAAFLGSPSY